MLVYVVTQVCEGESHVCAVTPDKDKVDWLVRVGTHLTTSVEVEEFDTECNGYEFKSELIPYYEVFLPNNLDFDSRVQLCYRTSDKPRINDGWFNFFGGYFARVFTDSEEEALRIANEMRDKALAERHAN